MSGYQSSLSEPTNAERVAASAGGDSRAAHTSFLCALFTHVVLFLTVLLCVIFVFHFEFAALATKVGGWKFNWHPVLMVSAFCFCMGEAIIAYRVLPYSHHTQKMIHLALQTVALIASSVALYFIWTYHVDNGIPDFYTSHAITGISAYSLFVVQYILGFISFFKPRLPDAPRAAVLPYHKYIGVVLFLLTWLAMLTGLMDRQRITNDPPFSPVYATGNAMGAMLLLSAAVILYHLSPVAQTAKAVPPADHQRLLP